MNLFDEQRPAFVAVNGDKFSIGGKEYPALRGMIQKCQQIRKFFRNGKLYCYSMDAKISKSGKTYCAFCDDNYRCHRKIRVGMIMIDGNHLRPVILDVNQPSFDNLQSLIEDVGNTQLAATPVRMKIVYDDNDRRIIEFTT